MDLPDWDKLDLYSTSEEEEEDDDDDDEEEQSNVLMSRKKRELEISLRFFEDDTLIGFYVNASGTVDQLINFIRIVVQPNDDVHKEPLRIRDGAMFLFQGKNLGDMESSCTLRDLGMEDRADIFIIYPGPFKHGTRTCKSSSLKSLVENAMTAAERGDTVDTFLMHLQGNLEKSGDKVVFEIAASIGTILVSLDVAGYFTVDTLKSKVHDKIRKDEVPSPLAYVQEGLYMLVFERKVLEDGSATLDECGIKDKDRIVLCPNVEFTATVVLVLAVAPNETQVHGVVVQCSDTVGQLKMKIKHAAGITSSEEIILRCDEKLLIDDHCCLLEYGLVEFPRTHRYKNSYLHRGCNVIVEAVTV